MNGDIPAYFPEGGHAKNRRFEIRRCPTAARIGLVLILGAIIGIGLPMSMEKLYWKKLPPVRRECQLPPQYRVECLPASWDRVTITEEACEKLHCCWDVYQAIGRGDDQDVPRCFHSLPSTFPYLVLEQPTSTCLPVDSGNRSSGTSTWYTNKWSRTVKAKPSFGEAFPVPNSTAMEVRVDVDYLSDDHFVVKILDLDGYAFEPDPFLKYEQSQTIEGYQKASPVCPENDKRQYDVNLANHNQRFYLDVSRHDKTRRQLFNTEFAAFLYAKQYLELTAKIPSKDVYGLGEGNHLFLRHFLDQGFTYTLFNRQPSNVTEESYVNDTVSESWYGSHPFYLCIEHDGQAHGVLLAHTNALEVTASGVPSLTFRTNGRRLKIYFFMGPTPADVIRQLTSIVGKPVLPPYWGLGHHVCRTLVKDTRNEDTYAKIVETAKLLKERQIPHESDCILESVPLFPWSSDQGLSSYAELVKKLTGKDLELRITLVHSPMLLESTTSNSAPMVQNSTDKAYVGVYNGHNVTYLDVFQLDKSFLWVRDQLLGYNQSFDGYILDGNVPVDEREHNCSHNELNNPPFVPGAYARGLTSILKGTLCMDSCHVPGLCSSGPIQMHSSYHYNLHNLYGHGHAEVVYRAVANPKKRPFIVSLSTFTGTGRYAGHWGGKINATWDALKMAVVQMLEFNLYGIPLTGMPACGYTGLVDKDLCSRWAQLSAFQPLSLTYRETNLTEELHPYLVDEFVGSVAAAALQIRYALMPYFYTVFKNSSLTGDPVVRPLFYEWPKDKNTRGIDEQFLWGPGLMISPVLHANTTSFKAYFPKGTWYDFYDGSLIYAREGYWETITAIEYHINIHIRGGHIIASQRAAVRTSHSRMEPFKLQVALDHTTNEAVLARGALYIDDGESSSGDSFIIDMEATATSITLKPREDPIPFIEMNGNFSQTLILNAVHILGVKEAYSICDHNSTIVKCSFNSAQGVLSIRELEVDLTTSSVISWKV